MKLPGCTAGEKPHFYARLKKALSSLTSSFSHLGKSFAGSIFYRLASYLGSRMPRKVELNDGTSLTPSQKAAILLVSNPPDISAHIFKQFDPEDVQAISLEISKLPQIKKEIRLTCAKEFLRIYPAGGGEDPLASVESLGTNYPNAMAYLLERRYINAAPGEGAGRTGSAAGGSLLSHLSSAGARVLCRLRFVNPLTPSQKGVALLLSLPPDIMSQVFNEMEPPAREAVGHIILKIPCLTPAMMSACAKELLRLHGEENPLMCLESLFRESPAGVAGILREFYLNGGTARQISRDGTGPHSAGKAPAESSGPLSDDQQQQNDGSISYFIPLEALAAFILTRYQFQDWFVERILSLLSPSDKKALGLGIGMIKDLEESRQGAVIALLLEKFTGDWQSEDDVAAFIRGILHDGDDFRQITRWHHRLTAVLLTLPEEHYRRLFPHICRLLPQYSIDALIAELNNRQFLQKGKDIQPLVDEFLAFKRDSAERQPISLQSIDITRLRSLYEAAPVKFREALVAMMGKRLEAGRLIEMVCRSQPHLLGEALVRWAYHAPQKPFLRGEEAASRILSHLDASAQDAVRETLGKRGITFPDSGPAVPEGLETAVSRFLGHFCRLSPAVFREHFLRMS
ncbi:MAG: hypothetical protein RDV48_05740 [Candidatus Eremiobacteraeota bacterium]|nr:hypothetical protein [Candidatus Eremiobacteraeota bacterium]